MTALKQLAKLRQFREGMNVTEYLSEENRQNLLAIEKAFSGLGVNTKLPLLQFMATHQGLTAGAIASALNQFTGLYSATDVFDGQSFPVSEDGSYLLEYNFSLVSQNNTGLFLDIDKNSALLSQEVVSLSGATTVAVGVSDFIVLDLKARDVLRFRVERVGGSDVTFRRLLLKITKI